MKRARRFPQRLVRWTSLCALSLVSCSAILFQFSPEFPTQAGARATRDTIEARATKSNTALMPEGNGYTYSRSITIDHTKVPNTDQSNFPVLISGTYSYLATVANGGRAQNSNGYDIIFTSDSSCAAKLNHETESYSASTGAVSYWVKVSTVSHTSDTTFYICYGNSSVTTDQSNKTGVWDSNYKGVWHFGDGSSFNPNDSTSNGTNGTNHSTTATAGKWAGGASFNGSSRYVDYGTVLNLTGTVTFECWWKLNTLTLANDPHLMSKGYDGTNVGTTLGFNEGTGGAYGTVGNLNGYTFHPSGTSGSHGARSAVDYSSPLDTTWHHSVLVWTGSLWKLYTDGADDTHVFGDDNTTGPYSSNARFIIGGRDIMGTVSNYLDGTLSEVRVSDTSRSADWIKTEYNNQSSPSTFYAIASSCGAATNGYAHRRTITIDHTRVPNTDQSSFPVLVSGTYSYLANVANGGNVQNSNGYDVIFTSDFSCTTKLNHEVESYNAATGAVKYWVRVPTASHSSDTVIYLWYGNAAISTSQENKSGVWDSYFLNVLHFGDGTTFNGTDSTSDGNTGTLESPASAAAGKIGGALYSNTGDVNRAHGYNHGSNNVTLSAWVKTTDKIDIIDEFGTNNDLLFLMVGDPFGLNASFAHKAVIFFGEATYYNLPSAVGTTSVDDGNWHHIVGIRDETNKQLRIYVDGVLEGTTTYTGLSTSNPSGINSRIALGLGYGLGYVDEFRESHTSRSADWIKTEYNNQNSPSTFYAISNQPPVANAGGPYTGVTGTAVQFNGSASSDPDDSIASYSWDFGDTANNSGSGATPTHTYATAGSYTVHLTVTDNLGATNSATASVSINHPPVANAGGPYTGVTGTPVSFNGGSSSDPDGTIASYSWNFGDTASGSSNTASGISPTHTYLNSGSYTASVMATDNLGATNSASTSVTITGTLDARLDPLNRTGGGGEDPLSRNFNWSIPIVSLPGRGGLDLGLSLAYNSLATWTRNGNAISFDDDRGSPSPGFRLGFPVIQGTFYNSQVGKNSFVMITPSGSRVELRQVGTSNIYQSVDSSYLLLDATTMTLKTTGGTQLSYVWKNGDYECALIKDRNGNYLTINYDTSDRIDTVVDTLSRTITFNYNSNGLSSITQTWAGQTHYWARFTYANKTIQTNFTGLTVNGPQNGTTIHALTSVKRADDSHYDFDYTSWGQVWKISQYTGETTAHLLNYRSYNLPVDNTTGLTECPRFTIRHDWAENWNRDTNGTAQEVNTTFAAPVDAALPDNSLTTVTKTQVTSPDGTYQQIYFAGNVSGGAGSAPAWKRGLPLLTDTFDSNNTKQRSAATAWTQDDTNVAYQLNPRVTESNITDPAGNHARTSIDYTATTLSDGTTVNLPENTHEYDGTTQLRRTHITYNLNSEYASRRIIGLVSEQDLYGGPVGSETLMSKVSYQYDESGSIQGTDAPVQHDNTNYSASLVAGRGNLSSVKRYDVTSTSFTTSTAQYNTAGAVVAILDPLSHGVTISYADSFSDDNNSRNTLAYPTTVTDAAGFSSTMKYNYDFGAATRKQTPLPNVTDNEAGPVQTIEYDSLGRLQKVKSLVNDAYTRYEYPAGQNRVDSYSTIQDNAGEAHLFNITDGHGRVIASAADHPGSTGGFSGQLIYYDAMGRVIRQSNPTESSASSTSGNPYDWPATGDDATANGGAGWVYSQQSFDWKGRPLVTTNTDGTTKSASYGGCGCAGGQVVTLTDEVNRKQKIYADVLGRQRKTEILNADSTVYSTTSNTFNSLDQVTLVRQYLGADTSTVYQDTTMSYDGYGRLQSRHVPEQQVDPNNSASTDHTTWAYNLDDTINSVTDARGVTATFGYDARHLLTSVGYPQNLPAGVSAASNVTFGYDAVGNRTSMTDGFGSKTYNYNSLSQLTSETRAFNGVGTFTLSYDYNLAGELKTVTDPWGATINYGFDSTGRLSNITGSGYGSVSQFLSNMQYRAWGALKSETYGNGFTSAASYNGLLEMTGFQLQQSGGLVGMSSAYQYYADGQLRYSHSADDRFDRAFSYDQSARVSDAYSGSEARDFINGGNSGAPTGPYHQSYQYDQFNQVTQQMNRLWSQTQTTYNNLVNNRLRGWSYDADGQITHDDTMTYTHDAAGQIVQSSVGGSFYTSKFDGDGRLLGSSLTMPSGQLFRVTYYLYSSVLGVALTKLDGGGQRVESYVYEGSRKLATSSGSLVIWNHEDPVTGSRGKSFTQAGSYVPLSEFSADGVDMGLGEPTQSDPEVPESIFAKLGRGSNCSVGNPNCLSCYLYLDVSQHDCGQIANLTAEMARAEQRYQSMYLHRPDTLGYDPEFDRVMGTAIVAYRNGVVRIFSSLTPDQYQQLQTAYLRDRSFTDEGTHDVMMPYNVTVIAGAEYFLDPQNSGTTSQSSNPNCLQNAVVGSPGIGRPFEYNPQNGLAGHDGPHALSPVGRSANARTLAPLAGTVIRVRPQEPGLSYMDVRLDNAINGVNYIVRYKDLSGTSASIGQHLEAGEVFGTVRPGSDPINRYLIGLHVTLVRADAYAGYANRVARGQYSNAKIFLDPLGQNSPINCPGVKLTR